MSNCFVAVGSHLHLTTMRDYDRDVNDFQVWDSRYLFLNLISVLSVLCSVFAF